MRRDVLGLTSLEELQSLLAGEDEFETLEFKRTTGELRAGSETLCAFLNGNGGAVLFGVANDKRVLGQVIADQTLQDTASHLRKLEPPAEVVQWRIPVAEGREVLAVSVAGGESKPYTYDGRPYKRVGNTTSRMPIAEYERMILARLHSAHRWENRPADGYSLSDLDRHEVERTVAAAQESGRLDSTVSSTKEAVERLGLACEGVVLQAAVIAFGTRLVPGYPQCALRMARFKGVTKTEFTDQRQLTGHAFVLLDEADLFLRRHLPVAGRIQPGLFDREDQPIFPPMALREALVNALCHRDYSVPGGAVSVGIFDDRLEIASTGTLPEGITIEDLKRDHASRPRNPILAEVFYRRGLVERWGRGTQKIVELCQAAGHPEPEFEERAGEVVVRFLPSEYFAPLRVSHDLTDRQREILQALADGDKRAVREIRAALSEVSSARTIGDDLSMLRSLGLVETGGHGRGARWWLKRP